MENKKWIVGLGGRPQETWSEYDNLEDAEDACLRLAEKMAVENGLDTGDVAIWYCDETRGGGACPEGDDGGYWPHFAPIG